mmetsp:Transcript_14715/g.42385  ORF Transcript_14715/g.42385 Transcript_14715/m.42385 type:complete len:586 (+) Transcript_14715:161-1918(+)|eukprot:CAMPEP_0181031014 /NCGR_PEP_ID=MMETSP1070-20121207/6017_1 /TAXON_ID=265543 /ORGANISM="Minutocellus polymorphus, Strain NH13" /LENGTH=585 /DNA_ID=CAMNT_0023108385 /DNA_START=107 /DNA_END=1867 /DNA_ORIENTATION=-
MTNNAPGGNETDHNINVCVRIRPQRSASTATCINISRRGELTVENTTRNTSKSYSFSSVVQGSNQEFAYNQIARPLLEQLRCGYSCTLCAYGQTSSGKTHSVFGPPGCLTVTSVAQAQGEVPDEWGIFPRLVLDILKMDPSSVVHASAIEIYQDMPYDLLADRAPLSVGTKRAGLKVGGGPVTVHGNDRASNHCGTHPPGCSCRKCFEAITKMKAMETAARRVSVGKNRTDQSPQPRQNKQQQDQFATVGETLQKLESAEDVARFALLVEGTRTSVGHALNDRSSRSHCLVNVHVALRATSSAKKMVRRKLLIVDLAGSERIAKSGVEGVARHQATSINGSLTVLGKVIRALSLSHRHVPYRDSTLTMLLRKSLDDPMASTSFVINVAPDTDHAEETACSLEFGKNLTKVPPRTCRVVGGGERSATCTDNGIESSSDPDTSTENELEILVEQLRVAKTKLAQADSRGQGEQFDLTAPEGEVRVLKRNLRRVQEEEVKVREARFELAELRALCKGCVGDDNSNLKKVAAAEARLQAREKELRNYQDIVARQQSIRGLFRPAMDVYKTCEREVRHLEARIGMLRAHR